MAHWRMPPHVLKPSRFLNAIFTVFILTIESSHGASCQPGGYALRTPESSCPAGSKVCQGGIQTRCCPSDTTCLITDTAFCCKGNEDCRASLVDSPRCPVADWSLWSTEKTVDPDSAWCCEPGLFGLVVSLGGNQTGVKCKAYGESLEQSEATASSISISPCTDGGSSSTSASNPTSGSDPTHTSNPTVETATSIPDYKTLSAGAIAGIAIGALVGIVALVVGGLILRRKNRKNPVEGQTDSQGEIQDAMVAQIDGYEVPEYKQSGVAQYGGNGVNHLDGNAVYELGTGQTQLR